MEDEYIKLGFSSHFLRDLWKEDHKYFESWLDVLQRDKELFTSSVRTSFLNIIGFLKSVHDRDKLSCKSIYEETLQKDKRNLNALIGLYEVYESISIKQAEEIQNQVNQLLQVDNDESRRSTAYSLLEIGLGLSRLIPQYRVVQPKVSGNKVDLDRTFQFDKHRILKFRTKQEPRKVETYSDYNIIVRDTTYKSVRYLEEGIARLNESKSDAEREGDNRGCETLQKDILIWQFFLGMAYNRLDNWIRHSKKGAMIHTRQYVSLKALECFSEIILKMKLNSNEDCEIYVRRSLAYIGHILTSRKKLLLEHKEPTFIPDCFPSNPHHILSRIWRNPKLAFFSAVNCGKWDPTVLTRFAKNLLLENKLDRVVQMVDEILSAEPRPEHPRMNWYAVTIRMKAYSRKHREKFLAAKKKRSFDELKDEFIKKAIEDGEYCYNALTGPDDLYEYAKNLQYLGKFPSGETVTDDKQIRNALIVLNRMYTETGCHTNNAIHRLKAQCHYDLGELDDAIKYMAWALNCCYYPYDSTSREYLRVVDYLLEKNEKQTGADHTKVLERIRYYMKLEVRQSYRQMIEVKPSMTERLAEVMEELFKTFKQCHFEEAKEIVEDLQKRAEQRQVVDRYEWIVNLMCRWCGVDSPLDYSSQMKEMIALPNESNCTVTNVIVTMCRACLERKGHTLADNVPENNDPPLSVVDSDSTADECDKYDFLLIHANEDKEWVYYKFQDEMENRSIKLQGNITRPCFFHPPTYDKAELAYIRPPGGL